jgi:hypothetical protein
MEIRKAKKSIPALMSTSLSRGISAGARLTITFFSRRTVTSATAPEMSDKSVLSVKSCPARRARLAPIVNRIAISRRLPEERARRRLAIFTQAMNSTNTTAPKRRSNSVRCGPDQVFFHRNQPNCPCRGGRILGGILAAELRYVSIEPRLGLRQRQARFQAANCARKHSLGPYRWNRKGKSVEASSNPHFHVGIQRPPRMTKSRGHHAYNRVRVTVEAAFSVRRYSGRNRNYGAKSRR